MFFGLTSRVLNEYVSMYGFGSALSKDSTSQQLTVIQHAATKTATDANEILLTKGSRQ